MNEKLQYASMLEIPVNTCNVTYKPIKKRRLKRKKHPSSEEVKNELLKKVNAAAENARGTVFVLANVNPGVNPALEEKAKQQHFEYFPVREKEA